MEGKHPETPKMTVEPAADAARGRDQVLTAIFEGIAAAYQATLYENNDPSDNCATFAETALASLKSSGFRVVRSHLCCLHVSGEPCRLPNGATVEQTGDSHFRSSDLESFHGNGV
ncbi:hypothetical protein [Mesorhizobium sp. M0772]|uniref:hypothetical protein n=1 Tax=Mesorhizobium sp. M0772 TaxID=2956998 RepID=UPI0033372E4A